MPRRLTDLIPGYAGGGNPEITGLTADSRSVKPGYLFAALPGAKADGRAFAEDAVKRGAAAILAQQDIANAGVPVVVNDNARKILSTAAARFYNAQPETVIAVTGTNGKTSTAHFTQQLWAAQGYKSASLGTLGIHGAVEKPGSLTTPDTVTLHADLADLAKGGVDHLAMEASSHGLDQYRLDGVKVAAAGFTNLTLDHLDYHETMDKYRAAKLRLFTDILQPDGIAVLNADTPDFDAFNTASGRRAVIDYGRKAKTLRIENRIARPDGQSFDLFVNGVRRPVELNLVGAFMAMNALCALGLASVNGGVERYIAALPDLRGAPGRLQLVGAARGAVYVDYAHTPDALDHVLKALRPHTQNRLIVIAGCGGDRDKTKRPVMGRIARDCADIVIITDDNPRGENPADIRAAMLAGAGPDALEIGDRHEAIAKGIAMMQPGDVLVIAGKGHEQGQTVGGKTHPFDDVKEAEKAIESVNA